MELTPLKKNRKSVAFKHYTRKFPGPAGLSLDFPSGEVEKLVSEETGLKGFSNSGILLGSAYSNILLSKPSYQRLVEDYMLNEFDNPLNHLTLQIVSKAFIRKAKRDMKVPFLGLLVSSISLEHGILWKLMDPTHEVNAVIHQNVWNEISEDVKVNSTVALMQIPVIASCTIRPPITLFISKKNLLSIYTETEDNQVEVKTFNTLPEAELKRTCSEWLSQMGVNPFGKTFPLRSSETRTFTDQNLRRNREKVENTSNNRTKWNLDDDFLNDLDLTIDSFGDSSNRKAIFETGIEAENSEFGTRNNESFIPKRPKIDFGQSDNKLSPALSTLNPKLVGGCGFNVNNEKDVSSNSLNSSSLFSQRTENENEELSQSEKLMVQEVLNGITFDDFDS